MTRSNEDAYAWFREARYGMMVHFGLYSLLAGEYRGGNSGVYAEWIQSSFRIPVAEYEKLATAFNPVYFDADEWAARARDFGMRYLVLVTKHHDGFALFRSKADLFNVVDASPFRRDIVEEVAAACSRHGLRLGLYYSQDLDWHERDGGGGTCRIPQAAAGRRGTTTGTFRNSGRRATRAASRRRSSRRSTS